MFGRFGLFLMLGTSNRNRNPLKINALHASCGIDAGCPMALRLARTAQGTFFWGGWHYRGSVTTKNRLSAGNRQYSTASRSSRLAAQPMATPAVRACARAWAGRCMLTPGSVAMAASWAASVR